MPCNRDLDLVNIDPKCLSILYTSQINRNVNQSACDLFTVKVVHIYIQRDMRLEATKITFPRDICERPQPWKQSSLYFCRIAWGWSEHTERQEC